jgi:RNA polymerase sigma factor (sigma-70 family)
MISRDPTLLDSTASDAELVAACRAGERAAFARIVERYQRLLCSLAYAATGSLGESEDVAQETFIVAWGELERLQEPAKLRPWLCGILRHKLGRLHRDRSRAMVRGAEPMVAAQAIASEEPAAPDLLAGEEEQRLLWRALARLPEAYREPLVLYYRENRSIEHVAGALDLTEDAVKQRLARGRKLLQEQALAFVEGALARTTPGKAFTLGVLAALPALLPAPAKAAGLGAVVAAHGGWAVKTTGLAAVLASASGVVSTVLQLRVGLDQARTQRERRLVVVITVAVFFGCLAFLGVIWGLRVAALHWWEQRVLLAAVAQGLILAFIVAWPPGILWLMRFFRRVRSEERRRHPESFQAEPDRVGSRAGHYRSRWSLCGVPLVHVRFASPDEGQGPVFGWIAGGDRAYGLLFAWGGWAIAPVSVGGFAAGFLAIGAVSLGVIGLGTVGVGLIAVGSIAVGLKAYAGISALGWFVARSNGFGIARVAADAPVALAEHANTPAALALVVDPNAEQNQMIIYSVIAIAVLGPISLYARAVRRRLGSRPPADANLPG